MIRRMRYRKELEVGFILSILLLYPTDTNLLICLSPRSTAKSFAWRQKVHTFRHVSEVRGERFPVLLNLLHGLEGVMELFTFMSSRNGDILLEEISQRIVIEGYENRCDALFWVYSGWRHVLNC